MKRNEEQEKIEDIEELLFIMDRAIVSCPYIENIYTCEPVKKDQLKQDRKNLRNFGLKAIRELHPTHLDNIATKLQQNNCGNNLKRI